MQRPSPVTLSSVGFPDCKGEPPHARSTAAASTAAFPHVPKKFNGPEASHTDSGGYKVTVKAYEKENHGTDRHGEFHITHPSGKTKRSGYWMDYPEKGWKHEGVDLRKDYDEHYDRDIEHKSHWRSKVPIEHRVAMEAKHQATAYKPLKDQWKESKDV